MLEEKLEPIFYSTVKLGLSSGAAPMTRWV